MLIFLISVPVVLQKPWKQDVASFKDEVELSCASSKGNPLPKIVWYSQPWSCTTSVCAPDDQLWTKTFPKVCLFSLLLLEVLYMKNLSWC